eukprot:scaffold135821_cov24-Tisochrysis_lutea.AAC.2
MSCVRTMTAFGRPAAPSHCRPPRRSTAAPLLARSGPTGAGRRRCPRGGHAGKALPTPPRPPESGRQQPAPLGRRSPVSSEPQLGRRSPECGRGRGTPPDES